MNTGQYRFFGKGNAGIRKERGAAQISIEGSNGRGVSKKDEEYAALTREEPIKQTSSDNADDRPQKSWVRRYSERRQDNDREAALALLKVEPVPRSGGAKRSASIADDMFTSNAHDGVSQTSYRHNGDRYLPAPRGPNPKILTNKRYPTDQRLKGKSNSNLDSIARNDPSPEVRAAAVSHMTSILDLEYIVQNDRSPEVRAAAASRLKTEIDLDNIARRDLSSEVRAAAASRMTLNRELDMIAQSDRSPEVRAAAASRMTSNSDLDYIARRDRSSDVRIAAISRLTSKVSLNYIARHDRSTRVRLAAKKRLASL